MSTDHYNKGLKADKEKFDNYFRSSITKTEQQKFLETLLNRDNESINLEIADIACGGGTLTYHLSALFPDATFTLVDYLDDALEIARDLNKEKQTNRYIQDDIYKLASQPENKFDLVFCWQTLSWLDKPEDALKQLVRITKPGGTIYLSSLFNLEHEVDIYSKVFDYTRESGINKIPYNYNTYSKRTIKEWLGDSVKGYELYKFNPEIDFAYNGKGIGTYTIDTVNNVKLQVSAGILLNWAILKINK